MGAFRGSITYDRYYVRGALPEGFRDRFVESVRLRSFRPLEPDSEEDHRVGWCAVDQPFDTDLTASKIFFNDYLTLGFRIDQWRIPSALFKASMRDAEQRHLESQGLAKLSRAQRKDLEAIVVAQLRRKLVPSMKVVDLSWSLGDGVVRFFSQSQKTGELMQQLFEKTFDLELTPHGAFVVAQRRGLRERALDALPGLEPIALADREGA